MNWACIWYCDDRTCYLFEKFKHACTCKFTDVEK